MSKSQTSDQAADTTAARVDGMTVNSQVAELRHEKLKTNPG